MGVNFMVRVGLIRARKVKVGRIKGFIGGGYGCKGKVEDKKGE